MRKIPVLLETNVVVVGGGPAGICTAIMAARGGVRKI
jgi:thioredoxin reductase